MTWFGGTTPPGAPIWSLPKSILVIKYKSVVQMGCSSVSSHLVLQLILMPASLTIRTINLLQTFHQIWPLSIFTASLFLPGMLPRVVWLDVGKLFLFLFL